MRISFFHVSTLYIFFSIYLLTVSFYYYGGALLTFYMPLLYFVFTYAAALYLWKRYSQPLLVLIQYFLLTVSIMYSSASTANSGDLFATLLFQTAAMLCLSLLVHFLYRYYEAVSIKWPYFHSIAFFYSFPFLLFFLSCITVIFPAFQHIASWATLLFFANGLLTIFYIVVRGYILSRKKQLLYLLASCILPFLPYVLFVALPQVVLQSPFMKTEWASLFFMLLPVSFLCTQLTERLFELHYSISRIRYYGTIATVVAACITAVNLLIIQPSLPQIGLFFIATLCVVYIALYAKEQLDFKNRKLLFSAHSNTGQSLYSTIAKLNHATTFAEVQKFLLEQVKEKLRYEQIEIVETCNATIATYTKVGEVYRIGFHPHYALQIGVHSKSIAVTQEEILWLELIALYTNALLHNFTKIEQLHAELSEQAEQIPWLQKLVFQYVEQEKAALARELHDHALQEVLFIARGFEQQQSTQLLREQMLDVVYELREFCETLSPPLLATMGIEAAMHKLVQKVNMRASFHVELNVKLANIKDEAFALMLYRVVQELCNNALKHSEASNVQLDVRANGTTFTIVYKDDNAHIAEPFTPSIGLTSMQQRVQAYHGTMTVHIQDNLSIVLTNEED